MNQPDFYSEFENRYRGSRDLIKSRLQAYWPFLAPLLPLQSNPRLLDLGCGRGEWLELTTEWGFDASGVDVSDGMLAACRGLNLNVRLADALQTLRSLDDESLSVVSAFHVVEHIPFDDVRAVIQEALRVLQPGGLLILETPNPENLVVGATTFYLDPTHIRPIPPLLLSFATEFAGFLRNKIVRLQGLGFQAPALHLEDVLKGVSADYSVVAQKTAAPDALSPFSVAFSQEFGTTLEQLIQRYDRTVDEKLAPAEWAEVRLRDAELRAQQAIERSQEAALHATQAEERSREAAVRSRLAEEQVQRAESSREQARSETRQARARAEQAEMRAEQAEMRAGQAELCVEQAKAHADSAEARAAAAAAEAAMAAQHIDAVLRSSSWRLSAPVRWAGAPFVRLTSAVRQQRVQSGIKRRMKTPLRAAAVGLAQYQTLQHAVSRCLDLTPQLKRRLAAALAPPPGIVEPNLVADQGIRVEADPDPSARKSGRFGDKTVAVLSPASASQETGGAERLYNGLVSALRDAGCVVDRIYVTVDESTFERIQDGYLAFSELDLSSYDLVISTKAPSYAVRHPNHVLYLVHTVRVFYDMFDRTFPSADATLKAQRDWIVRADNEAFGRIARRFSIGEEVSRRLRLWNGYDATVLHPPMEISGFREGEFGNYFFIPGRLHRWKRLDLLIMAVKSSSLLMHLVIAGVGEAEQSLRGLAAGDARIEFVGRVDDERLKDLYAGSLAVPFVPLREDYGYVTLEAFASGKPVITCEDSGEPTQFVEHGETGLICQPNTQSVRQALERLWNDHELAAKMGRAGRDRISNIQWPAVATRLLEAGFPPPHVRRLKVAVLDMQPIMPAVGGGRLRLLGLYHGLGGNIDARYVGTYDWPGEGYRRHYITPTLEEIDVPLSSEHHEAAAEAARMAGGRVVIDLVFGRLAHLSPDYLTQTVDAVKWADVVVFAHPWVAPLIEDELLVGKTVVYDSQNMEKNLRTQILNAANPFECQILKEVEHAERLAGDRAHLVLVCSSDDAQAFESAYGWPRGRMVTMPNGVFSKDISPPTAEQRRRAREELHIPSDARMAFFIGSNYDPNIDAARIILEELAPRLPNVEFVIAGGVCTRLVTTLKNVRLAGILEDGQKLAWLHAANIALNPMCVGSGTNIKMFDFMAAGLPVISTAIGARGIATESTDGLRIVPRDEMVDAIADLVNNDLLIADLGAKNRELVETRFSWERISPRLGMRLKSTHLRTKGLAELNGGDQERIIAHFGTIGIRCGIGEYARKLIEIYGAHGMRNFVLTCDSAEEEAPIPANAVDIRVGWYYDNQSWSLSHIKPAALSSLLEWGVQRILIQYHPAYYSPDMLVSFAQQCLEHNIAVAVVVHRLPIGADDRLRHLIAKGAMLFSHSEREVSEAREMGVDLTLLPLGVDQHAHPVRDISNRNWVTHPPVIVTNGFLREHKGASRLIEAMPHLLKEFPGAVLRIQCAIYPSNDSRRELETCQEAILRLNLADHVVMDTRFLEKREVLREIDKGDLVILPYAESSEGGSASATDAIGLSLPLIVSSARVFDDLREVVVTSAIAAESLAQAVIRTLRDPPLYRSLSQASSTYATENCWENVAGAFLSSPAPALR